MYYLSDSYLKNAKRKFKKGINAIRFINKMSRKNRRSIRRLRISTGKRLTIRRNISEPVRTFNNSSSKKYSSRKRTSMKKRKNNIKKNLVNFITNIYI